MELRSYPCLYCAPHLMMLAMSRPETVRLHFQAPPRHAQVLDDARLLHSLPVVVRYKW
jgi:hypothetical protein